VTLRVRRRRRRRVFWAGVFLALLLLALVGLVLRAAEGIASAARGALLPLPS
jgi:ABC-type transporter Mla subunit MlaD